MRKSLYIRTVLVILALFIVGFWNGHAQAFDGCTHKDMVEVAVYVMQQVEMPQSPYFLLPPPDGVDQASWNSYLGDLRGVPGKLSYLRVGTFNRGDPDRLTPSGDDPCTCYYPEDNMAAVEGNRIMDFSYVPIRPKEICSFDKADKSRILGGVLGWHALMVDEHLNDVVGWIRPWNAAGEGVYQDIWNKAWEYGVGAILLPFVCLWDFFTGGDCDYDTARDVANDTNPVYLAQGMLPGAGSFTDSTYTGLWHFMDPEAVVNQYNNPRGMYYLFAGPDYPGALDVSILAASLTIGMSLNADESDGVQRYGQFDRPTRGIGQWQSECFGLLEWSPIQNLGEYGWEEFQKDPTQAYALGWPLHAIGDSSQTHHIASTTSWGHRPAEDAVNDNWATMFPGFPPQTNCRNTEKFDLQQPDQIQRILISGFKYWKQLKLDNTSFKAFLINLATETRDFMDSMDSAYDLYNDLSSIDYFIGNESTAKDEYMEQDPIFPVMQPSIEWGIGAMIGFLATAADRIHEEEIPKIANTKCPEGTFYDPSASGCVTGQRSCNVLVPPPDGVVPIVSCIDIGRSCESNSQCCTGMLCDFATKECRIQGGGSCSSNDQCLTGMLCDFATKECRIQGGGSCSSDDQCLTGMLCINNICVQQCHGVGESCDSNSPCCTGLVCSGNVCYVIIE